MRATCSRCGYALNVSTFGVAKYPAGTLWPCATMVMIRLPGQAFFISAGDYFRIWNPAAYEAKAARRSQKLADQYPEDFDPRSLLPALPAKG